MPLTVRQLLNHAPLELVTIVPGALDDPIRWVHPSEEAEPGPYLRGGEVVLSDGYQLDHGVTPDEYVSRLIEARVAALGYGLIKGRGPVPPALVDLCRERGLTLFAVPEHIPFVAISEFFVDHLAEEREAPLRETIDRNERFLNASSSGIGALLSVLTAELGRRAAVLDAAGRIVAFTGPEPGGDELEPIRQLRNRRDVGHAADVPGWWVFQVRSVGRVEGVLAMRAGSRALNDSERTVIDQAVPYVALQLAHARSLRETHRRFAVELFGLIRAGDVQIDVVVSRIRAFGLDPDRPMVAVVCQVPDAEERLAQFEETLAALGCPTLAASRAGELIAVVQWDRCGSTSLEDVARSLSHALGRDAVVGIGGVAAGSSALSGTLAEATHACAVARLRRDGTRSVVTSQIGSHTLLLALQDPEAIAALSRAVLQPVVSYDERHHTDLLDTLVAFLSSNGQWQGTAEALHIHVNTLRHRILRIEELTGRSLDSIEDRVDLFLALRARELRPPTT